ncbi:MAG: hypothetical protein CMG66_05260 [Candidatus Marinimicrobia bacterium]|nr:hypothetical protein [Candidatus Neomarinimicrobiota bacterium]|tara:strand:- start:70341 stop:71300 length:960 start_codon:yes stop_codon:yes gene_type:complete
MRNFFIYIFILFTFLFSQEEIGSGLIEDNLINYLQNNYTTSNTSSYTNARNILYGIIDNNNGYVSCIYTNYSGYLSSGGSSGDNIGELYNQGINCEHLWPQSLGASNGNAKSDMHHLRPCKDNVNSTRSNKPFSEINDYITDTWFWLEYSSTSIPTNNIDEYSESTSNIFEPREDVKGDIARAMFYFYTIYNNVANENFFNDQKEVLYEWHLNDPVNDAEISRTWSIASYQNNIPNPFIIDETLIYRAYFYEEQINEENIGDVTQDGLVNIVDIVLIVNYVINTQTLTDNQIEIADIDQNGTINIIDIVALISIIIGEE